jgi:CubicO group peptidase (beta-lactamase class C family)
MIRFFIVVFLLCSLSNAQPGSPLPNPEFSSAVALLEHWIDNQMAHRGLPGLALGVVYDQQLIYARGFGTSDIEKKTAVTPSTIFRMASITKLFTSTAIMQLRDAGKLQLDDPVAKHLPWFRYKNTFPDGPQVTIRHLLTHTSGLPREAPFPYWTDHKFPTREQMIGAFSTQESVFEPFTKYKYSNLGMAILGEVVAEVSGLTYEKYVHTNILVPLGMSSSSVVIPEREKHRLATGYGRRMSDGSHRISEFVDAKGLIPAANLSSTVEDMARFAMLQFREGKAGGGQILKGSTIREMHRPHWVQPSWRSGWGLGWGVSKSDERVTVGHGGWVGGYRTQLTVSPSEKVAVIVMTNSDDGIPSFFANRAMSMLAPILKKIMLPPVPEALPDARWTRYVGTYTDPFGWEAEVMVFNKKLVIYDYSYPPEENPLGELTELTPEGADTFRMTGENGSGERVVFELDANGKVVRVKTGENYMFPKH